MTEERLKTELARQARRIERAERDKRTLLAQTVYLGTLGLVIVLPIVGGAYLGLWLDGLASGYSSRWTVSCILLGVFVGGLNAYLFVRERQ